VLAEPSIPVAQIRAAVALLGAEEMTPTAKRMLLSICDQYDRCDLCKSGDHDGCVMPASKEVCCCDD
jgi:Cys-tRNA synthase (O-phospho-L-seryl-tRNA:Cys-tRNA synthase)